MQRKQQPVTQLRLAELLAALSLVADLGMDHPPEEAIRACLLATGLARRMNLAEAEVTKIYYTTLLKYVGCTAYAHEEALIFGGDDIALRSGGAKVDFTDPRAVLSFFLLEPGRNAPLLRRTLIVAGAFARGSQTGQELAASHCEVAAMVARRLGLPSDIQTSLYQVMERWDGKGGPGRLAGEAISLPARFALAAAQVIVFERIGGPEGALEVVRKRSATALDPAIAAAFLQHGPEILEELATLDACRAVVEAEPKPHVRISEVRLDQVARAFADMVDLKVPFLRGHSASVAELAAAGAHRLGLAESDVVALRRAALLHDLGRVGIANGVWEKPGSLTVSEWEQIRLHPYHTERILSCSTTLAPLAPLAGMHHERLDGSGYYRQATAATVPLAARVLAAADAYQAMTQARPYRKALSADAAAETLLSGVKHGQFDGAAVQAVLAAAGHVQTSRRRAWPADLSDREVEVLILITRGAATKQVATALGIAPKTAGHHIQHIYDKIGVSTRAGAAMFAMEHGLVHSSCGQDPLEE